MEIKHPEWLQFETNNCRVYGYNQEWYQSSFQRTRGCGPTAATMLLSYLNRREDGRLPYLNDTIALIRDSLENVWNFVTPGWLLGLNSTQKFCKGVTALCKYYGLAWQCHRLSVTALRSKRAELAQVAAFLETGLASDCPVAFLNLHKGQAKVLESWHWIVLIALSYEASQNRYLATCYDGGRLLSFDLGLWLQTTSLGGGFVYLTADRLNGNLPDFKNITQRGSI